MPDTHESKSGTSDLASRQLERRSFLRALGVTLAAGLGAAVLPGTALASGRGRRGQKLHPNVCGVVCSPVDPSFCGGCSGGGTCMQCHSDICGYTDTPYCDTSHNTTWCACNGCC